MWMVKGNMMAILLAAGVGSRLQPYTQGIPKPLVPLGFHGGRIKVVAERLLEQVKAAGINDVVFVVNHKKEAVMDYFGNGSRFGVNILYCFQEELNGDAGGIYLMKDYLKETFMVMDADNYYEDDMVFKKVLDYHKKHESDATVATTKVKDTRKYAIMKLEGDKVLDLVEKPLENPKWDNDAKLGIFVFEPNVLFKHEQSMALSEQGSFSTTQILKSLSKKGHDVRAVRIEGHFTDIGTWDRYQEFQDWLLKHGKKA